MRKIGLIRKIERFEVHHRIIAFFFILIGTIVLTRLFVVFHNPNPVLFDFEIHHFDYGILLLLISSTLLLFGRRKHDLIYMFMTAVAGGLIIDDYWFIRKSVVENPLIQTRVYEATFPAVVVVVLVVVLATLFFQSLKRRTHD